MDFFLVFSANLATMSFINYRLDGKETRRFCFKINLLRNDALTRQKHQFLNNKQDQILFQLNLMGIIFTIKHCISKERCNAGWGGARPF